MNLRPVIKKSFYIRFIAFLQSVLILSSILLLMILPILLAYYRQRLPDGLMPFLYDLSLWLVFVLMIIRPLADLLPRVRFLRPLIVLRKGLGIASASIIVSAVLAKVMLGGFAYLSNYFTKDFWTVSDGNLFAHLGDVTGFVLLVTSSDWARRVMKRYWKRVQRLSYVYFFSGSYYVYSVVGHDSALWFMIIVGVLTLAAFVKKMLPSSG